MAKPSQSKAQPHEFEEVRVEKVASQHLDLHDLRVVKLRITAELGSSAILVRDVLELKLGSVVTLDKMAGEMTDILVNGLPLAKGEVVVIGDSLHVRIVEIFGTGDMLDGSEPEE